MAPSATVWARARGDRPRMAVPRRDRALMAVRRPASKVRTAVLQDSRDRMDVQPGKAPTAVPHRDKRAAASAVLQDSRVLTAVRQGSRVPMDAPRDSRADSAVRRAVPRAERPGAAWEAAAAHRNSLFRWKRNVSPITIRTRKTIFASMIRNM